MTTEDLDLGKIEPALAGKPCAFCGNIAEGYFGIHRDGYGIGPEVPLCVACGGYEIPTCEDIWNRISQAMARVSATVDKDNELRHAPNQLVTHDIEEGDRTSINEKLARGRALLRGLEVDVGKP